MLYKRSFLTGSRQAIIASTAVAEAAAPMQITLIKMEIRQAEYQFLSQIVPECSSKTPSVFRNRDLHSFLQTSKNCIAWEQQQLNATGDRLAVKQEATPVLPI